MATSSRVRPVGSRLCATEVELVSHYLRKKVERNKSSFIETKNIYEDEPWRLNHRPNKMFKKNEWYYFVHRNRRGGNIVNRTVPKSGDNQGGTWKTTGERKDIFDEKKKVMVGHKQSLVYNKTVNTETKVKTNWLMTEYSLYKGGSKEFQELVLCWIRQKKETKEDHNKVNFGVFDYVPQVENNNNIIMALPNQEEQEDVTHQPLQQQEQDTPMMMMPTTQSNDNNFMIMMMPNQEEAGWTGFAPPLFPQGADSEFDYRMKMTDEEFYQWGIVDGNDHDTISLDAIMNDVTQQQCGEERFTTATTDFSI